MLFLAIPMYAAPFVLVSVACFAVFRSVPSLQRFAIAAFVAPSAFGACALVGFIGWILFGLHSLRFEPGPGGTLLRIFAFGLFLVVPGVLGSATAVWAVNKAIRVWHRLPIAPSWKERTIAAEADC